MRYLFREYGLPLLLLAASVVTTTANGARFMQNFIEGMPPVVRDSDLWPWAWLSTIPICSLPAGHSLQPCWAFCLSTSSATTSPAASTASKLPCPGCCPLPPSVGPPAPSSR